MSEHSDLRLPVPERRAARSDDFDIRPARVEDWLRNLPVTDVGETGRQVYDVLHGVNRMELRPSRRLAFLEQLRGIVDYVAGGLRHHCRIHELPMPPRPRRVMELAGALLHETALGYEIAVTMARSPGRPSFDNRALALALERGLRYRARVVLEHWLVYQGAPPQTWQRLHTLYALAETHRLADRTVRDDDADCSPAGRYKQVVLAAAVGPQQLHREELVEVWRLLGHWAETALLVAADDERADDGVFRVPRSGDGSPHPAVPSLLRHDDRVLLTSPLVRRMERELATTDRRHAFWRREPLRDFPPELCQRLMFALGEPPGRRHLRMRARAPIQAVTGLNAIHELLCDELALDEARVDSREHRFQSRDLGGHQPSRNVWNLLYPRELAHRLNALDFTSVASGPAAPAPPRPEDWSLANLSAHGYCLVRDDEAGVRVQVGELIALREIADRALPWQLGTVRWLRAAGGRLELGVEILNHHPLPVAVRSTRHDGNPASPERGLLLPADPATESHATLITAPTLYATDRPVRLRHDGGDRPVIPGGVHDANALYVRFGFRFAEDSLEPPAGSR